MSEPTMTCGLCGRVVTVRLDGRHHRITAPDVALRTLERQCRAAGCACNPKYRAGIVPGGPFEGQDGKVSSELPA
jgi:hypothetical protein